MRLHGFELRERRARGAHELPGSSAALLTPGARFDTARDIDAERPHGADRRADIARVQAAREHQLAYAARAPPPASSRRSRRCRCARLRTAGAAGQPPDGACRARSDRQPASALRQSQRREILEFASAAIGSELAHDLIDLGLRGCCMTATQLELAPHAGCASFAARCADHPAHRRREHETDRIGTRRRARRRRPRRVVMPQILIQPVMSAPPRARS